MKIKCRPGKVNILNRFISNIKMQVLEYCSFFSMKHIFTSVDCILNDWQSWACPSECTADDKRQATRNRTVERPAKYDGECWTLMESAPCEKYCSGLFCNAIVLEFFI